MIAESTAMIEYLLERLPTWGLLFGSFGALLALEWLFPLRKRTQRLAERLLPNVVLSALGFAVGFLLLRRMSAILTDWTTGQRFGLLQWIPFPPALVPLQFAVGFLLMDFSFYLWHRANHEWRLLWRFHNVHHVDLDMDVTTSFRFHFVEIGYSTVFRVVQVSLIGVSWPMYVVYEAAFQTATMFHHSNLRLPLGVERVLNWMIVTPRMHGIHHSIVTNETNANYGTVFRWWDVLCRSLVLAVPTTELTIGVAAYQQERENTLWNLIRMPFVKQKEYGRLPDGGEPARRGTPAATKRGPMMS